MGYIKKKGKLIKELAKQDFTDFRDVLNHLGRFQVSLMLFSDRKVAWEIELVDERKRGTPSVELKVSTHIQDGKFSDKPPETLHPGDHVYFIAEKRNGSAYGTKGSVKISPFGGSEKMKDIELFFQVPYRGANRYEIRKEEDFYWNLIVYPTRVRLNKKFAQHYYTKIALIDDY